MTANSTALRIGRTTDAMKCLLQAYSAVVATQPNRDDYKSEASYRKAAGKWEARCGALNDVYKALDADLLTLHVPHVTMRSKNGL